MHVRSISRGPANAGPADAGVSNLASVAARPEAWLLRALIGAIACLAVVQGRPHMTLAASIALALSLAPLGVGRWSDARRVPRLLEDALVLSLAIGVVFAGFDLAARIRHAGKVEHAVEAFLVVLIVGLLVLGARDRERIDLSDQLATLLATFTGVIFGVTWELINFSLDWVFSSDLQKSNADTMTNLLWNDAASVAAALLAVRAYCHWHSQSERADFGAVGTWLVDGPSRLLNRHGILMAALVSAVAAIVVAALWYAGRPVPGFPIG